MYFIKNNSTEISHFIFQRRTITTYLKQQNLLSFLVRITNEYHKANVYICINKLMLKWINILYVDNIFLSYDVACTFLILIKWEFLMKMRPISVRIRPITYNIFVIMILEYQTNSKSPLDSKYQWLFLGIIDWRFIGRICSALGKRGGYTIVFGNVILGLKAPNVLRRRTMVYSTGLWNEKGWQERMG